MRFLNYAEIVRDGQRHAHLAPQADHVTRLLSDLIDRMALDPDLCADVALSAYDRQAEPVDAVLCLLDALDVAADESGPDVVAQMRAALAPGFVEREAAAMHRETTADALEEVARRVRSGTVRGVFLVVLAPDEAQLPDRVDLYDAGDGFEMSRRVEAFQRAFLVRKRQVTG